jgi:dCMP deaminase
LSRVDWSTYFMRIAKEVAARSTCPRASVGAVLVKDNRILGTGYNGAPSRLPHCDEVGCAIVENHCIRTVHAEANAILQGMKLTDINGATLYCTHHPCVECCKLIINAGIKEIMFEKEYFDDRIARIDPLAKHQCSILLDAGVEVKQL